MANSVYCMHMKQKKQRIIKKMKLEIEISKCRNLDESNLYVKAD